METYLFQNNAVLSGVLALITAFLFKTNSSNKKIIQKFYHYFPMVLLAYFLPSLLTLFKLVDPERAQDLYEVGSQFFLPASIVLLTLSVDIKSILGLGPKAIILFLTGTLGVILGGPIAIYLTSHIDPSLVGGENHDAVWRGFAAIAGSWIGGGANMIAMKEIFKPSEDLYTTIVAINVLLGEIWTIVLIFGVSKKKQIDALLNANSSRVDALQHKMQNYQLEASRVSTSTDLVMIMGIAFGVTAASQFLADILSSWISTEFPLLAQFSLDSSFFWLFILATTFGILLSFTRAKHLEGAGASKMGTVFIFFVIGTIGLKMDLMAIMEHTGLFLVGGLWISIHIGLMFIVAYLIKAPYFLLAVASKANIGGAASAPVVAAAFHPSLAPVGVLLAVLGYALGTYGAYVSALIMKAIAPI